MKAPDTRLNKETLRFLILAILCLAIIVFDRVGVLLPVRGIAENLVKPLKIQVYSLSADAGNIFHIAFNLSEERQKVALVEKISKDYEVLNLEVRHLRQENADLRKQLEAPLPSSWSFQPAQVLGITRYMQVWGGSREGITSGMSVADGKVYVGRVISTTIYTSNIILPDDPDSNIPAISSRGTKGVVRGQFGEKVVFSDVLQKDQLFLGDEIITSGEGGYAPGLLIGKIGQIEAKDFEIYKKGDIVPATTYNQETTVFVVKSM